MKKLLLVMLGMFLFVSHADAVVFINEIYINPTGGYDSTREFIELMGTPGMKLDGFAIALANGTENKYWPEGAAYPADQEIDEFFSLDGLELGANGILVIAISVEANYSTVVPDTNFQRWNNIWNGGLDDPGKLQNDGANTILLIRNRPGRTEADPSNPAGLRWGKDISHDRELTEHVEDPQNPGLYFDQWGNGNLDKGEFIGFCTEGDNEGMPCQVPGDCPGGSCQGVYTLDLKGSSTLEVDDDLEVVDEVSYEHGRGWEYDVDGRHVDSGSTEDGLPYRHVHALDDPQGFNPDCLTRVDYRTKGEGWAPAAGATGELPTGNNWQDTATEQWIRGEGVRGSFGEASAPFFYYSAMPNDNGDSIQPYVTNVPLWLDDALGVDFDFTGVEGTVPGEDLRTGYQIMAGRVNPLAVAFIPGDSDRDGDCDSEDIAKIAAVFGDDNWIFSNSYSDAPETDEGDPATQTRPWDVDGTGSDGIEASDLQWSLNFQGDTTGRVVGITYDSETPAASGVYLNSNAGVDCAITAALTVPSGHPVDALVTGDLVELVVSAEVTAGANDIAGQQNGVMQFVHDLTISNAGVVKVVSVEALGEFNVTRAAIETLEGDNGDEGISLINGYSTSFVEGIGGASQLYRVVLQAVSGGTTSLELIPASSAKFAASTPWGVKVGHTDSNGNPEGATYAAPIVVSVIPADGDFDGNDVVNLDDYVSFVECMGGPDAAPLVTPQQCQDAFDFDTDTDVDLEDAAFFAELLAG